MSSSGDQIRQTRSCGYSIASVSKLTGVSCHTLRIWERRYGLLEPTRSPSGHRRYSLDQVNTLRWLAEEVRRGRTIGACVKNLKQPGAAAFLDSAVQPASAAQALVDLREDLIDHLVSGRLGQAEALFLSAKARMTVPELLGLLATPCLVEAGERWFQGDMAIYQEHIVTNFIRSQLHILLKEVRLRNESPTRTIVVGGVQGDRHEGGVMLGCILLELANWRTLNLGVDLPFSEYQAAVERYKPDAVGVSFVLSRSIHKRFDELSRIKDVPVFVSGRSILNYQGLARRYGLIPLSSSQDALADEMLKAVAEWKKCEA